MLNKIFTVYPKILLISSVLMLLVIAVAFVFPADFMWLSVFDSFMPVFSAFFTVVFVIVLMSSVLYIVALLRQITTLESLRQLSKREIALALLALLLMLYGVRLATEMFYIYKFE